jgi:hypothetical protein
VTNDTCVFHKLIVSQKTGFQVRESMPAIRQLVKCSLGRGEWVVGGGWRKEGKASRVH